MVVYNNGMHYYSKDQLDKIGNTIVYLASNIKPLYKTKVLKLLYLLDEFSIKRYGIPFLNLEYKVWQAGPVCSDIFLELDDKPYLLEEYISLICENNTTRVEPIKKFSDDEFSDTDLQLLNEMVHKWGKMPAEDLVNLTHRETAPWYKTAKENGLLELFENKVTNTSDVVIDMSELIKGDEAKENLYSEYQEYNKVASSLKA